MNRLETTILALVGAILSLTACASAGKHGDGCTLRQADSVYMARGPVYRDCAVDKKAEIAVHGLHSGFTATGRPLSCYSAEVEFVVDTLGNPEENTARVIHANEKTHGDAVLALVPQLKYTPAMKDGSRVRQITTFTEGIAVVHVVAGAPTRAPTRPPNC